MIQKNTILKVTDNSGGVLCMCIDHRRSDFSVGDIIVVSIKESVPNSKKVKKGDVVKAVIVRTMSTVSRSDGFSVSFGDNAVVLLDQKGSVVGTRVFGSIAREVRLLCPAVTSLCSEVR